MVEYRFAGHEDVDDLMPLADAYFDESPHRDWLKPDRQRVFDVAHNCIDRGAIVIATADKQPVGLLPMMLLEHTFTGMKYADGLLWFVMKPYRNGLVGPRILKRSGDWARSAGAYMLKVTAPHGSDVGRFLEMQGDRPVETVYVRVFPPP